MKSSFQFKQFAIQQQNSGMKVTSDAVLLGAFAAYHHSFIQSNPSSSRLLDIGCGTGLLSIMLAQKIASIPKNHNYSIDAIDIDDQALIDAKYNCGNSQWQSMIHLYQHSILDMPFKLDEHHKTQTYRLIICNPPFYHNNKVSKNIKRNQAWHLDDSLSPSLLANKTLDLLCNQGEAYFLWPTIEAEQFVNALLQPKNNLSTVDKGPGVVIDVFDLIHKPNQPSKRSIIKICKQHGDNTTVNRATLSVLDEHLNYQADIAHILRPYYSFLE